MSSSVRHALVTGAGTGIGAATATALAQAGLRVTLLGRERADVERHAATLPASAHAHVVAADVTDRVALEAALAEAQAARGPIEILVNNAGIGTGASLAQTDDDLWSRTLATTSSTPASVRAAANCWYTAIFCETCGM